MQKTDERDNATSVERTFRTKTGSCKITRDRILLSRNGVRGAAAKVVHGNAMGRTLVLYGVLGIGSLVFGILAIADGSMITGAMFVVLGAVFVWNVAVSRHNSATPIIEREAIRDVTAHPPRSPATRGYFTVTFEEDGRLRKRLIILPGLLENGSEEFHRAVAMWKDAGFLDKGI